jgi:hypothetical protein
MICTTTILTIAALASTAFTMLFKRWTLGLGQFLCQVHTVTGSLLSSHAARESW